MSQHAINRLIKPFNVRLIASVLFRCWPLDADARMLPLPHANSKGALDFTNVIGLNLSNTDSGIDVFAV